MQYNTLTNLYRENWVVKRLIDVVPEDMTKSWYRIKSQLPPDRKQQITRLERVTRIRERVLEGMKWGRLYGGAVAVIVIDGHDDILDQPLDYDTIMPGSFKGLIIVDRWSGVSPSLSIVENVDDPEFGLPEYYTISTATFGFGVNVHHSRILRFTGRHLPYIEELAETYWGTSELEHVYSEIVKYDNTSYNIAALVFSANLKIYKMDGFEQLGTAPQSVIRDLYNTLTMMNYMMNSQGMQIMGKEDAFETQQFSFAGLSDIYELFMLDVSGASEIPVTRLFGRSPAGMNATGESDMQNYYDSIEEKQEAYLKPVIDRLLPILCMSELFSIPDDLDFEFEPIRRPSEDEKKTISTQVTTAISTMFNAGVISQKIALKELRESSRATGMWNNITDEDIARADSEFGTGGEPPDIMGATGNMPTPELMPEEKDSAHAVNDKDIWLSTENGEHFKLGEGGKIKAGLGGKFTGEKLSALSPKNYSEAAAGTIVTAHVSTKSKGDFNLKYQKQENGKWKSLQAGSEWSDEELEQHLNKPFSDLGVEQPKTPEEQAKAATESVMPTATTTPTQAVMNKVATPFSMEGMQGAEAGTQIAYTPAKGKAATYTLNENGKWVNEANNATYTQKAMEKVMAGTNPNNLSLVKSVPAAPSPIQKPTAEHYSKATPGTTVEYKPAKGKPITFTKQDNGKWLSSSTGKEQTQSSFENLMSGTNPETLTMIPPAPGQATAQVSPVTIAPISLPTTGQGTTQSASLSGETGSNPFTAEAYSQQRKNHAVWAKTKGDGDKVFRSDTEKVWATMSTGEKQAAYGYTLGSGKFNRPLRGYEGDWDNFKGVGKVSLNAEGGEKKIHALTSAINKASSSKDAWVQRGDNSTGAAGLLGMSKNSSLDQVFDGFKAAQKSGKPITDEGFLSCGTAKGSGFGGSVIYNIYCPKGTKMIYAEPFSHFAGQNVGGAKWDGKKKQDPKNLGGEFETIIQRGTSYRVTKVEKKAGGGKLYVDIEVVAQKDFSAEKNA
jgi:phage-related protein (TIGR01555 family)